MNLLSEYTPSGLEEELVRISKALEPKPSPLKPGETRVTPIDSTPEDREQGVVRFNIQHMAMEPLSFIPMDLGFTKKYLGTPHGPDGPIEVHKDKDGVRRLGLLELCDE